MAMPAAPAAAGSTLGDAATVTQAGLGQASGRANMPSMTELGCLLGSFRDVVLSTGMQVTAIWLTPRVGPISQRTDVSRPDARAMSSLPSRRLAKLKPLIQTFTDCLLIAGYVIKKLDLKQCDPPKPGDGKDWVMEVFIGDMPHSTGTAAAATTPVATTAAASDPMDTSG